MHYKVSFSFSFKHLSFSCDYSCIFVFHVLLCVHVFQIGVAFYEMLQAVDQHCQHLSYMDPICDFLYHIKYMYTGDSVKEQVSFNHQLEIQ